MVMFRTGILLIISLYVIRRMKQKNCCMWFAHVLKKSLSFFGTGAYYEKGWELPPTKEIESVAYMYDDLEISAEDK